MRRINNKKIKNRPLMILIGIFMAIEFNWPLPAVATAYYYESDGQTGDYQQYSRVFIAAADKAKHSVVNIYTEKTMKPAAGGYEDLFDEEFLRRFFPDYRAPRPEERRDKQSFLGSGFIVNPDGYILTNSHVVKDADSIKVKLLDGTTYTAKLVGQDEKSDLAVLKIENAAALPYARLGDSDNLEVGEWVIALGNPVGLVHTVTAGIVSALGRTNVDIIPEGYEDFIQTDVSMNPGNSGGPLINLAGDVVGINTGIYSNTGGYMGIGFAIPVNMAKKIMVDLIEKGTVERGYLGVYIQDLTPELAEKLKLPANTAGVLISEIIADGPAGRAGLRRGDIIVAFNGKAITDAAHLRNTVAISATGKKVDAEIMRDGKKMNVAVVIDKLPGEITTAASPTAPGRYEDRNLGITISTIDDQSRNDYGLDRDDAGVLIVAIDHAAAAGRSGLKTGDIIIEIDKQTITSIADFTGALKKQEKAKTLLFLVKRSTHHLYLIVKR